MTQCIDRLPATKSNRHGFRILFSPCPDDFSPVAGMLTIVGGRVDTDYRVEEFTVDWAGRGFLLVKDNGEAYSCFIAKDGRGHRCDCFGATAHGKCKHQAALVSLVANGSL